MTAAEAQIQLIDASAAALKRQLTDRSIIWIGAGASIAAGYPSAAQLVTALKEAADDWIMSENFPEVTDQFVRSRGEASLRQLLQREIGGGRPSTEFHHALASLAKSGRIHTIITTNYDDLIERTLGDHGVPCIVQTFEANFEAASANTVRLIKVHGSYQDWRQVILSGESYTKFAKAYGRLHEQMNVLCRQYPLTFIGSSLLEPRVLGWLAGLKEAERKDLLPWRAFLTLNEWNLLLDYKTPEFEARNLLVGQLRPLILREHAALQTIWADVARELAPVKGQPKPELHASSPLPTNLVRTCVLLREAVVTIGAVAYGAGPTTALHRRIEIADKWLGDARKALSSVVCGTDADAPMIEYLNAVIATYSGFAAKIKNRLPKAGESDAEARQYALSTDLKHALYFGREDLSKH
jgi:NAD-dependent SIR2 family protein deacetylase